MLKKDVHSIRVPYFLVTLMRLSQFILSNLEVIRAEWESFASTVLPKSNFDELALRDEADEILKTIANDMETPQTASEQAEKSKGRGPRVEQDSAAETHGADRLRLGFNQAQVVSEYRALRATVIRLWIDSSPEIDHSAIDQLFRFNEGIDQALSESAARFMQRIEESRDFSIAVLAHDLRNPLNVIISSAQCFPLVEGPDRAAIKACASAIFNSGMHMSKLIENLLDLLERASDSLCLSSANQWILPQFVGRPSGNCGLSRAHDSFKLQRGSSRNLGCHSYDPDAFESNFECNRAWTSKSAPSPLRRTLNPRKLSFKYTTRVRPYLHPTFLRSSILCLPSKIQQRGMKCII